MAPNLQSKLTLPPDPLGADVPSANDLKGALTRADEDRATQEDEADEEPANKRKLRRAYTFSFSYVDGNGKKYDGTFTNRILDVKSRALQGALFSDMIRGRPTSSIPGQVTSLVYAVSWMTFSLDEPGRPKWAADLSAIDDDSVILQLFAEVWSHQCTFRGRPDEAASTTASPAA